MVVPPNIQQHNIYQLVSQDFAAVNELISQRLNSDVNRIRQVGQHLVDSGGKRIRPLLVLLCCHACQYPGQQHIQLAAIIEFLHTATLIHDDVVDDSALRRGQATANSLWGNPTSVLTGDFLYSRAFQMMVELKNLAIMDVLANATNVIAEGEVLQLVHSHDWRIDEQHYMQVIGCKTAELFAASAQTAAILAQATDAQIMALKNYGLHLGLAFQLIDDVLDYSGHADSLGKNPGDDLLEGKVTLPVIYSLRKGDREQTKLLKQALTDSQQALANWPAISRLVDQCGALDYCLAQARQQAQQALTNLNQLPDSNYRQALADLVNMAITRVN
jgi:octaprenyl-diphosphate synthase